MTDGVADLRRASQSFRVMGAAAFADPYARHLAQSGSASLTVPDQLGDLS